MCACAGIICVFCYVHGRVCSFLLEGSLDSGCETLSQQVIKTFSMREGWWYIGIKGGGGVKSKGTRIVIEKEKKIDLY